MQPIVGAEDRIKNPPTYAVPPQAVLDQGKPAPREEKPKNPPRAASHSKGLKGYTYELSPAEMELVREDRPNAAPAVHTNPKTVPMSWEKYNALTPDQRAAVDFNTLLAQAREVDLKADLKTFPNLYSEADLKQYELDVASIFGPGGGSDTIGFRTVELLKKIDFTAVGQDLDEYLSMERGISDKELKDFTFSKDALKQVSLSTFQGTLAPDRLDQEYAAARAPANLAAVDTAAITAALNAYKNTFSTRGANTGSVIDELGIQMSAPMMELPGYERAGNYEAKFDQSLKDAYDFLRGNPTPEGMAAIFDDFKARNWTAEDQQMLWNYLNDRTRREIQYFEDAGSKQIRDLLGWE